MSRVWDMLGADVSGTRLLSDSRIFFWIDRNRGHFGGVKLPVP
jgi:hypothetical protein